MLYQQSRAFVVHCTEIMHVFFRLHNQAPPKKGFTVQFSVQPLPEPEPNPFDPEPRVQFRVQAEAMNRTNGSVRGSGKRGSEPN